jgi:hypothetical protein
MQRRSLALALSVVLVLPAAAQTTWHVDVNAVPPGDGSAASPYASIQHALEQASTLTGDTLLVAPGLYVESIHDVLGKSVHLLSAGGPAVTELRPLPPTPARKATVSLFASTIEGFTLTGNATAEPIGGALNLLGPARAVRCVVRDNPGWGVFSDSATLEACTVVGNGKGVHVEFFAGVSLRDTIVWGNTVDFTTGAFPVHASYCAGALPEGTVGNGNLVGDPGLWDFDGARHLLKPGSPCIDAGNPSSPPDPDGSPTDIGAIPFDSGFAPGPTVYCTPKISSLGCMPQIGFQGSATFDGSLPFLVTGAHFHAGMPGLLFYGPGAHSLPFQGAWHCVEFPTPRVGGQIAGGGGVCGGNYSFDFAAHLAGGAASFVQPGSTLGCQWWSRDPFDPTGWGTVLSNALLFGVAP